MTDTVSSSEPPFSTMEDESMVSFTTLFLALVTLAAYLFFLKPTAGGGNDNTNNNNHRNNNRNTTTNTNNANTNGTATRERQQHRGGGRRQIPQQQPAHRRRLQMSENAMEILGECQSLPPHVVSSASASSSSSSSSSKRTIGGFDILSENGLVVFSHTRAACSVEASGSSSRSQTPKGSSAINVDAPATVTMDRASSENNNTNKTAPAVSTSLLQRKERAKILSRLFAATHQDHHHAVKGGLPVPPSKGSTFVIGISREQHLLDSGQRSSLLRAIRGLAAHYTVLVVVSVAPTAAANSSYEHQYESTQTLHSEAIRLLRGSSSSSSNNDESETHDYELAESVLPSHRVLLAGLAKGRVALVRQLSTNIGLTVDFDRDVREELERFGYEVSIVEDWTSILPADSNGNTKEAAKP